MTDYLQASDLWDELMELQDAYNEDVNALGEADTDRLIALVDLFAVIGNERAVANRLTLIPAAGWDTYARDYAEDAAGDAEFLFAYVDWDAFAGDLASDYQTVTFEDEDFLYRS